MAMEKRTLLTLEHIPSPPSFLCNKSPQKALSKREKHVASSWDERTPAGMFSGLLPWGEVDAEARIQWDMFTEAWGPVEGAAVSFRPSAWGAVCSTTRGPPPQETLIKLFWVHTLSQNKLSRYSICLISFVCMCSWLCLLQLQMSAIQNIKLAHLGSAPPCMEHYSLAWVLGEICSVLNISVVRKTSDGRSDPTESFIFSKKGLELVTATRWVVLLVLVAWSQLSQDVGAQDKRSQAHPYAPPESPGSCLSSFTLCKGSRYSFSF